MQYEHFAIKNKVISDEIRKRIEDAVKENDKEEYKDVCEVPLTSTQDVVHNVNEVDDNDGADIDCAPALDEVIKFDILAQPISYSKELPPYVKNLMKLLKIVKAGYDAVQNYIINYDYTSDESL
ncbi:hypothetical protein [Parasitella parasitica]|uniref:Uncharacterized protein n=1 Tax=Parasitella parasitica TaxID=35722 RepID=A0A0B7N3D2_9FUNG|nr:hypothetical protein [Parasitella parasitica]